MGVQRKAARVKVMEFLNAHREDEDPCECVILPDGGIEKSMEPLFWLVEYTGCTSVWQTRVVSPSTATQEQEYTLEELYDAALLSPGYLRETAGENYRQSVERAREAIAKRK